LLPLPLALAIFLVTAGTAWAAISIQKPKAEPLDGTVSNSPTRFHTHVEFGGTEHIKDFTTQTPRGLGANTENPTCTLVQFNTGNGNCPANTQIGTTTVNLSLLNVPPVTQNVSGKIYFLEPDPGKALPGLGIILNTPNGVQRQRGEATIDAATGTLKNTIRNFPTDSNGDGSGVPIRINSLDVTLLKSFVKNPGDCGPATTYFFANSYETPGTTAEASDTYNVTGCTTPGPQPSNVRCKGKRATKVGNKRSNKINGTARRDVIAGLGGNDVIRGLKGNDIICGGVGNDRLIGGPGKDTLVGGAGKDKLVGGPNKDRLIGGPGADTATQ
jgi:Ca2+-binding RTX toxin-like protein